MEPASLRHNYFFIIIPRSIPEDKIKDDVSKAVNQKQFWSCKIMNAQQHRPMFFYLTSWDEEAKTCDGLFDIPTTIGTLLNYQRIEAPKGYSIEAEIVKFQNVLIYLVARHPKIKDRVRILSVPWPVTAEVVHTAIKEALRTEPAEFPTGLTLEPVQPPNDWLTKVEHAIDSPPCFHSDQTNVDIDFDEE